MAILHPSWSETQRASQVCPFVKAPFELLLNGGGQSLTSSDSAAGLPVPTSQLEMQVEREHWSEDRAMLIQPDLWYYWELELLFQAVLAGPH